MGALCGCYGAAIMGPLWDSYRAVMGALCGMRVMRAMLGCPQTPFASLHLFSLLSDMSFY